MMKQKQIDNIRWELFPEQQRRDRRWQGLVAVGMVLGAAAACWAVVLAVVFSLI